MQNEFRPPAVPLVTVDPYFSIWSCADAAHQDATRHWTLARQSLVGLVRIDGTTLRFLGTANQGPSWHNEHQPSGMRQVSVRVNPTRTVYRFDDLGVGLEATYTTPLLIDELDLMSRPFSYVELSVRSLDGRAHTVQLLFLASAEIASAKADAAVVWERTDLPGKWISQRVGTWEQNVLGHRGDLTTIDWGYFHLITGGDSVARTADARALVRQFRTEGTITGESAPCGNGGRYLRDAPALAASWDLGQVTDPVERVAVLGYDDVASIDYFGTPRRAYCFRDGRSFLDVARAAVSEWPAILSRCRAFDASLLDRAEKAGGRAYADLIGLAYRQSIAAHKLIADEHGRPVFLSKECSSNGSIGTVDVSYPSTPLYLLLAPELVAGMLRPVFRFASSAAWTAPYAPHDVGTYPRATGQTYGMFMDRIDFSGQMPVEESGNMLIMTAAHADRTGTANLAVEHWDLLTKWADYLVDNGFDPEHQLCTDDFAGHLARNTNLSLKAIIGIACYARLCDLCGRTAGERYMRIARDYATRWVSMAREGDHYRLTFDGEGTWSLKYNLVWDRFFGFGLFKDEVAEAEVEFYAARTDRYGVPLDNRASFTKTDWLVWAATLTSDRDLRRRIIDHVWLFANETPDRTPLCDWYDTHDAREQSFHNRTVIGGIFMPLLMDARGGVPSGD